LGEISVLRVLIADDHPVVREGVRQIFATVPDIELAAETSNGTDTVWKVRQGNIDVVLLDISLPGTDGIDVLKQLKRERPRVPVLMFTIHPESDYAVRSLRAGAAGYIVKDVRPAQLIEAVRHVARGGRYITPAVAEQLAFVLLSDTENPHERLSDREFRVMCLIASGKSHAEIGAELNVSPKTVSTYRGRILEKMNMRTNAELTHYAIQRGLVS
jgi:DNA-binding NarL/FixJ family response regulator